MIELYDIITDTLDGLVIYDGENRVDNEIIAAIITESCHEQMAVVLQLIADEIHTQIAGLLIDQRGNNGQLEVSKPD